MNQPNVVVEGDRVGLGKDVELRQVGRRSVKGAE
jgi:hypothetical protein